MTSRDGEKRKLHDYIDGRLSAEDRERFEARLQADPELAARVSALRELGRSLREGDEELPPGFYTRARAAFEEASRERAPRRWFRPLSWETAGLVAVVAVAAAVYVPHLVRSPLQREPWRERESPRAEAAANAIEERPVAGEPLRDDVTEGKATIAPASPAPEQAQATAAGQDALGRGGAPKKGVPEPAADRDKREAREAEELWAPSPPTAEDADEAALAPAAEESKTKLQATAEVEYRQADVARSSLGGAEHAEGVVPPDRLRATPLPSGLVEPGALRVVELAEEWRALLEGPARKALLDLGGRDPRSRLVLIGARSVPFDCERVSVVVTEAAYRIRLSPPPLGGRAAEDGCALLLPRDGRAIELATGGAD